MLCLPWWVPQAPFDPFHTPLTHHFYTYTPYTPSYTPLTHPSFRKPPCSQARLFVTNCQLLPPLGGDLSYVSCCFSGLCVLLSWAGVGSYCGCEHSQLVTLCQAMLTHVPHEGSWWRERSQRALPLGSCGHPWFIPSAPTQWYPTPAFLQCLSLTACFREVSIPVLKRHG